MELFIDTSALIAILIEKDKFHHQAMDLSRQKPKLHTSSWVLEEFLAHLQVRFDLTTAKKGIKFLQNIPNLEIHFLNHQLLLNSFDLYNQQGSKRMTLVDVSNVVIMKEKGLNKIFAFDNQFATKFNLEILPATLKY